MVLAEAWAWRYMWLLFWGILLYIDSFRLHFPIHFIVSLSISLFLPGLNNLLMAYEDKSAYALCIFSLSLGPNAEPIAFLGKTPVIFFLSLYYIFPWWARCPFQYVDLLYAIACLATTSTLVAFNFILLEQYL